MSVVASSLVAKISTEGDQQAKANLKGVGAVVDETGSKMRTVLMAAAAAAGIALVALGGQSVKMAGNFQSGMTSLVTGAGEAASNLKLVSDGILKMAPDVGQTTKALSDGMYLIESAGYHGKAGLDVLKAAAQGAKVGAASLADVANGVTTEMVDYASSHLTAAQATNTLIATVASGKTHMADLANAMSTILPTSAAVGVSLTDTSAAMATMTAQGTDAASASTYLRQLLMALVNPSSQAAGALKSIGLSSKQVSDEMKISLPATLQLITDHLKKKFPEGSAAYVAALADISGGSRQMQGMLELTGQHLSVFKSNVTGISDAVKKGGDSITGWATVTEDFNYKLDRAKATVETFGIKIGTVLLPVVGRLLDAFSSPAFQQFAAVMGQKVADALAKVEFGIAFIASALRSMAVYAKIALEPFGDEPFGIFLANLKDVVVASGRVIDALTRIGVALLQGLLPPLNLSARTFSSFFATVLYGLGDFLAKIAVQLNSFAALLLNSTNMTGKITAIRTMLADLFSWLGSHASSILTLFAPPIVKIIALLLRLSDVLHIDQSALSSLERYIASSVLPLLLRLSNALDIDTTHGIVAFARSIQEKLVFALQYAYMSLLILGDWIRYGFTKALEAVAPLILAVGNAVQHALGGDSFKSANEALRTLAQDGLTLVLIGLDWLKYGAQQVSDWFDRRIKPAINGALPSFERLGDVLLHVVGPAIGRMALDKLDLFGFILGKVGSVIGRFLGFAIQLGSVLAEGLATGLKIVMPLVETLSTVFDNLVSSGVGEWAKGLIHVMDQLSPSLDHLRSRFAQIGAMSDGQAGLNKLQKGINDFFVWLNKSVKPAIDQAMPSFQKLGDVLLNTVAPALGRIAWDKLDSAGKILEKLAPVIADAVPFLIKLAGVLSDGLARALKFATPLFEEASKALSKLLVEIIDRLGPKAREEIASLSKGIDAWGKIWAVIAPGVKRGLDDIVRNVKITFHIIEGLILAALDVWTGDWGRLWDDIKKTVVNIYDDLVGHSIIPDMMNKIAACFRDLPSKVMTYVNDLYNQIVKKATDISTGFVNGIKDLPTKIGDILSQVTTKLLNWKAPVVNSPAGIELTHHATGILNSPFGHLAIVGEKGPELMYIPKFASILPNNFLQSMMNFSQPSFAPFTPSRANVAPASVTNAYQPKIIVMPAPVYIGDRSLANQLMPHIATAIHQATGGGW